VLLGLDELGQHPDDRIGRHLRPLVLLRCCVRREKRHERLSELVSPSLGHAEQLADDGERQREREARHQVDRRIWTVRLDVVEEIVDHLLDPRLQRFDPAQRERGGDQPAEPGVVGRVDVEHVAREGGPGQAFGDDRTARGQCGLHVLRQPRIVECSARLVVADDQPRIVPVGERDRVDAAARAYVGEERERIVPVVRAPRRERLFGRHPPIFAAPHGGVHRPLVTLAW